MVVGTHLLLPLLRRPWVPGPFLTVWEMLVLQCLVCDRLSPPRPAGSRTEAPSLSQGRGCCLMLGWEPRRDSLTPGSGLWRRLGRICQNPSTQREVRGPNLRAQRSRDPPSPPCRGGNALLSTAAAGAPGRGVLEAKQIHTAGLGLEVLVRPRSHKRCLSPE